MYKFLFQYLHLLFFFFLQIYIDYCFATKYD